MLNAKAYKHQSDEYLIASVNSQNVNYFTLAYTPICVTTVKTALLYMNKLQRSKYEKENCLTIEFNK